MCGRFSIVEGSREVLIDRFGVKHTTYKQDLSVYNAAPSMKLPMIVRNEESGNDNELVLGQWGFMPPWMKNFRPQANARLETVAEKRMFRDAFKKRHCLVPANSFFEWSEEDKAKQPYLFKLKDNPLFAFAGIWEPPAVEGGAPTFSLITTEANSLMAKLHHRLPVILQKEDEDTWLNGYDDGETLDIQTQYPAEQMEMYPVTSKINKVAYQEPDAIEPVAAPQGLGF